MTKIKPVRKCYNCDFFHQTFESVLDVGTKGECYYDPPVDQKRPVVLNSDWCGKNEKRNENHD